jgi:CBS domain-containing protein
MHNRLAFMTRMNAGRLVRSYGAESFKRTQQPVTAMSVFEQSCYYKLDFRIVEESSASEAIAKFSAFNIGSLAVTNNKNKLVGVLSQRDIVTKICSHNKCTSGLFVKDICTYSPNVIVAKSDDSLETCMNKMIFKDIRHLLVVDENNDDFIGMISMKDVIKEVLKNNKELIMRLSDFRIGKGGFFGSE